MKSTHHRRFLLTLRDGTHALVRPIRPDDKDRLRAGLKLLSPHSRYLRFHTAMDHLTDEQLRYLTDVDHVNHVAWVALNPDAPDEPGMGVARYVRLPGEPEVAEAAITVLDRYQGRGLGTLLLGFLARSAREHGIKMFRNYVLSDNAAMLELFDQLGATRVHEGGGVYRVDVPIPEDPDELPDTPAGQVLRAMGRGELPPLGPPYEEERDASRG